MKPIKLKMQAFGSYGKETVIDFTKPSQNLFLITGDTGSGKSTIFDAIVFALYGHASASEDSKEGIDLQSQFVSKSVTPYVELTFSELRGGLEQIYRVRREPFHMRKKQRGYGEKESPEQVELYRPDGTHAVMSVSQRQKQTNEINQEIVSIVGLNKAQFMQVAMIAQGDFIRLIRADTKERKPIFRKIFDTGIYERIITVLSEQYKEIADIIKSIKRVVQNEANKIKIPADCSDYPRIEGLQKRILLDDKWSTVELEEFLAALQQLCTVLSEQFTAITKQRKDAEKKRDEARSKYTKAETLLKSYSELEKAQAILLECSQLEEEIEKKAKLKIDIQKAYDISRVYELLMKANKALSDSQNELKKLQGDLPGLKKQESDADTAKTQATAAFMQKKDEYTRLSESVKKARVVFKKLKEAVDDELKHQKQEKAAAKAKEKAEKDLREFDKKLKDWKDEYKQLMGIDALLVQNQLECDKLNRVKTCLDAAEKAESSKTKQKKAAEAAQKKYLDAKALFAAQHDEFIALRNAFYDAQAGLLAATLEDGKPCPVCGSLTHPTPCELITEHQELTRELIEQESAKVDVLEKNQSELAAKANAALELLKEKEAQAKIKIEELVAALRQAEFEFTEPIAFKQIKAILINWQTQTDAQKTKLDQDKKRFSELGELIDKSSQEQQRLEEQLSTATKKKDEAHERFIEAQAKREEIEKQLEYPTEQDAEEALSQAEASYSEAEKQSKAADKAQNSAKSKREKAETKIQVLESQTIPNQLSDVENLQQQYNAIMEKNDLPESEWKGVVLHHKKEEAESIEMELAAFRDKKSSAKGMAKSAKVAVGEQPKPNADKLKEKKERCEKEYEQTDKLYSDISDNYKSNNTILKYLTSQMDDQKAQLRRFNRIKNLRDKLAGKENGDKIDIETMVQRMYLERILHAANSRFLEMSSGQFELRIMDQSKSTQKDRGLDLMVYSNVTGSEREIKMLSGGESFMAALALALGMSDQIQQNSAIVNLDIMFIDEGFGSLDAHSRNQAIKVLKNMAGGSRMIGLISHVTELKQQIDDKLVVERDQTGSHAHWVVS